MKGGEGVRGGNNLVLAFTTGKPLLYSKYLVSLKEDLLSILLSLVGKHLLVHTGSPEILDGFCHFCW